MPQIHLLAISGSLRRASTNSNLLEAAARCVPQDVTYEIFKDLGELPHFNPDLDPANFDWVQRWFDKVRSTDGLIVSTPEYAHGLPGVLKNALDWLVGSDAFMEKPFMLLNASTRFTFAQESLIEILKTMSGIQVPGASATLPLARSSDPETILANPEFVTSLRHALSTFASAIDERKKQLPSF